MNIEEEEEESNRLYQITTLSQMAILKYYTNYNTKPRNYSKQEDYTK